MNFLLIISLASLAMWAITFLLPWQPWRNREAWDAPNQDPDLSLDDVTILMPARNESLVIERTLKAVAEQAPELRIILVDDRSTDDTVEKARKVAGKNLQVYEGQALIPGWSGKLWALEQGRKQVETPYVMLLDSDVEIQPHVVAGLKQKMLAERRDFVSLMANPPLQSFWERMLMPAFIYFFKLLYPFHLANADSKWVAAAAGGCVMTKTKVLEGINGFNEIKNEVIDDCALARAVKNAGFRTWVGLTHSARSVRPYKDFQEIWDMVARTAYNQLNYSLILLLLCTALMVLAYWVPIFSLFYPQAPLRYIGLATLLTMMLTYLPTLHFYRLSYFWALCLPFIGTLFLGMTWTSAIRYWRGERLRWRGRVIQRELSS